MKRTVRWLLVRHGEHKDGKLTEKGVEQVFNSVKKRLRGVAPKFVFSSELPRAQETARLAYSAMTTRGESQTEVIEDEGFGYSFPERVLGNECWKYEDALRTVTALETGGRRVSVLDMFKDYWPPSLMIGGVLYRTMFEWSKGVVDLDQSGDKDVVTCLVGTHGTMVYATLDPKGTPGNVGFGEIMEYVFKVEDGRAKMVSSKLLTSTL